MKYIVCSFFVALLMCGVVRDGHALSCMQPNIFRTFEQKKKSDDVYMLVRGKFTDIQDETVSDEAVQEDAEQKPEVPEFLKGHAFPSERTVRMTFWGAMIGDVPTHDKALNDFTVEVEARCAAHWCGSLPKLDQEIITFLKKRDEDGDVPLLSVHACGGEVFPASDLLTDALRTCFKNDCSTRIQHDFLPR